MCYGCGWCAGIQYCHTAVLFMPLTLRVLKRAVGIGVSAVAADVLLMPRPTVFTLRLERRSKMLTLLVRSTAAVADVVAASVVAAVVAVVAAAVAGVFANVVTD